jgi:probable rRNA maturation factor
MPVSVDAPKGLAAPLRALVAQVLRAQGLRARAVGVRLTDDAELRALNRRWRGLDKATDVLSFRYDEGEPGWREAPVEGDLVVSLDRMRAQAVRFRVRPGAELARLVVHGTLHLCGHDHMRPAERTAMRAAEERALRAARPLVRRLDAALAPPPRRAGSGP